MAYLEKAKKLLKSGFWMAGYGHFDLTTEELATILELIEKNDFAAIKKLYKKLTEEKL